MSKIVELQQRAAELSAKYQKESITPEEVGLLHEDTLQYIADLERYVDNLGVRKVYASKAELDADTAPVGTNGKTMKFGQLAVIRSTDADNGNIYAFQKPGWLLVGNLNEGKVVNDLVTGGSNVPLSAEQGKVLGSMTSANAAAIADEVNRAKAAEQANANAVSEETTRAQGVENAHASALTEEVNRAKAAEQANATEITNTKEAIPTIADDLTTDDAAKALSAKQGKKLFDLNMEYDVSAHNGGKAYTLAGTAQVVRLTITGAPTETGTIIINLGDLDTDIDIIASTQNTAALVAAQVAAGTFAGYTVSYTSGNAYVDFIASAVGEKAAPAVELGATGVTGSISVTTAGADSAIAAVPTVFQKGGLTIAFIDSASGNYVKYFCNSPVWTTTPEDSWRQVQTLDFINVTKTRYVYPTTYGSYIAGTTGLVSHGSFWMYNPVMLKAGETLIVEDKNISLSFLYYALTNSLTTSSILTKLKLSISGNIGSYKALTDMYVVMSTPKSSLIYTISSTEKENVTPLSLVNLVDNISEKIQTDNSETIFLSTWGLGFFYLNTDGRNWLRANNSGIVTNPIPVSPGDVMRIELSNTTSASVSLLADDDVLAWESLYQIGFVLTSTVTELHFSHKTNVSIGYMASSSISIKLTHASRRDINTTKLMDILDDESSVINSESDVCLIMGSSLTYSLYSPKTLSWVERVNDYIDINIINGGRSGVNLAQNISELSTGNLAIPAVSVLTINPRYIVSNNDANGTPTGSDLMSQLQSFSRGASALGAEMLLAGEEPTLIDWHAYSSQCAAFARGNNYIDTAEMWHWMNGSQPYRGWIDGSQQVHSNFKNATSHVQMMEMLSKLPIRKGVKMYKVREGYKAGAYVAQDLIYTDNYSRALRWRALCPGIGGNASPWAQDNIDGTGYINNPTTNLELMVDSVKASETTMSKSSTPITFYHYALIEVILPRINVTQADVSIVCSGQPTEIAAIINGVYTTLSFSYIDGLVTVSLKYDRLQDYDKIKLIVSKTDTDTFTIGKCKVVAKDGVLKPVERLQYKGRNYGTELMTKTSVESGWTFSGNASVKSLPPAVANYTMRNSVKSHIQLDDDAATATYTQSLGKNIKKVAVRIAACIFPPIQTVRTSNEYTTTEQNIFRGQYYGGDLLLTICGTYIPLHIEVGWMDLYCEAYINSDTLTMTLGRLTNVDQSMNVGGFPVFIHDVSVQEI